MAKDGCINWNESNQLLQKNIQWWSVVKDELENNKQWLWICLAIYHEMARVSNTESPIRVIFV